MFYIMLILWHLLKFVLRSKICSMSTQEYVFCFFSYNVKESSIVNSVIILYVLVLFSISNKILIARFENFQPWLWIVDFLMSLVLSFLFCFMYFETLSLVVQRFCVVMCSWIDPFYHYEKSLITSRTDLCLEVYFVINRAIASCFHLGFVWYNCTLLLSTCQCI